MRTISILFFVCYAWLCMACNNNHLEAITGTYVCTYRNEYSTGNDTLVINAYNANGGVFEIERRTGYHKIRNGQTLPVEFKQVKWTATYNKDKQVLAETAYGRQVYLANDWQSLRLGDTRYQRLK